MNISRITDGIALNHKIQKNNMSTNPFIGSNFRGNVLPFSDVFQSAKNIKIGTNKISDKAKMISSAFVGRMTDFGRKISEPISEITGKIKSVAIKTWEKVIAYKDSVNEKISGMMRSKDYINPKTPVEELRNMFQAELEAMGGMAVW